MGLSSSLLFSSSSAVPIAVALCALYAAFEHFYTEYRKVTGKNSPARKAAVVVTQHRLVPLQHGGASFIATAARNQPGDVPVQQRGTATNAAASSPSSGSKQRLHPGRYGLYDDDDDDNNDEEGEDETEAASVAGSKRQHTRHTPARPTTDTRSPSTGTGDNFLVQPSSPVGAGTTPFSPPAYMPSFSPYPTPLLDATTSPLFNMGQGSGHGGNSGGSGIRSSSGSGGIAPSPSPSPSPSGYGPQGAPTPVPTSVSADRVVLRVRATTLQASTMTVPAAGPQNNTSDLPDAPPGAARADSVRAGMTRRLEEIHAKEQLYSQVRIPAYLTPYLALIAPLSVPPAQPGAHLQ